MQLYGHVVEDAGEICFDASVVDITAAEAASAKLHSQREELERTARTLDLVVRQMPAMYWLVDHDLRILRTGGAIEEVLGYAAGSLDRPHAVRRGRSRRGTPTESLVAHAAGARGRGRSRTRTEYRGKHLVDDGRAAPPR